MVVSLENQLAHAKRKVEQNNVRQSEEGGSHGMTQPRTKRLDILLPKIIFSCEGVKSLKLRVEI